MYRYRYLIYFLPKNHNPQPLSINFGRKNSIKANFKNGMLRISGLFYIRYPAGYRTELAGYLTGYLH
jgi:hypothetical protein